MKGVIKEAFLLSAGLGTRLKPYTDTMPKPLVKVCGKPMIQWNLELLAKLGCTKIIINVHYKKEMLIEYLKHNPIEGVKYVISEEDELLDTGGGLKKVFNEFESDRFFTWNSDIMVDPRVIDEGQGGIPDLIRRALKENSLASILVKSLPMSDKVNYSELGFDPEMRLCEFLNKDFSTGQVPQNKLTKFTYLGISVMHRSIGDHFPLGQEIFSLSRDMFPSVLRAHFESNKPSIYGSPCNYYWNDVGNPVRLDDASKEIGHILPLL